FERTSSKVVFIAPWPQFFISPASQPSDTYQLPSGFSTLLCIDHRGFSRISKCHVAWTLTPSCKMSFKPIITGISSNRSNSINRLNYQSCQKSIAIYILFVSKSWKIVPRKNTGFLDD
ncbi:MAG: hypothetical protein PUE57_07080, partial [Lactimicrobium massiliense]